MYLLKSVRDAQVLARLWTRAPGSRKDAGVDRELPTRDPGLNRASARRRSRLRCDIREPAECLIVSWFFFCSGRRPEPGKGNWEVTLLLSRVSRHRPHAPEA